MMHKNKLIVRVATKDDAKDILEIYSYYVENTAITFDYAVPSIEEFSERIDKTLKKYPYIVAELDNEVVGYAYAGPLKERAAYDWSVETTIYLKRECRGKGIGKQLYIVLENILREQNILNLYACIASPVIEDEYLTKESINFHQHLGYRFIGQFSQCGYKFNRWYNMVWMEKIIDEHKKNQPSVLNFDEEML